MSSELWFASARIENPGLSRDANICEVRAAIDTMDLDGDDVEQEDDGCFLIPLPEDVEHLLNSGLADNAEFTVNGITFTVSMP